jgi:hypothetical protein
MDRTSYFGFDRPMTASIGIRRVNRMFLELECAFLFLPEGHNWICLASPPSGNPNGEERNCSDYDGTGHESRGIRSLHSEQESGHHASQRCSGNNSEQDSC